MLARQESGRTLESVNKQMVELKKKVQLAEGQRKAQYEEWDTEKRLNEEKIKKTKDQIKNMYRVLALKSSATKTNAKIKYGNEIKPLLDKETDEARELLDLKVIDAQKKMDLLNHQIRQQEKQLSELTSTDSIISKNSEKMNRRLSTTSKEITAIENQIHLTELNAMEANHLRQNYRAIKNQLTDESVAFESILNKLEEKINERESEVSHLEKIYNEAKTYKDITTDSLTRQEQQLIEIQKQRNSELEQLKSRVEDRKYELERLERQMFSNQLTSAPQITESDNGESETECSDEVLQITERLEKTFSKLKEVTGVTENEDVLKRFLSQKETADVLKRMKTSIEREKRDLEKCKEEISVELESCKFVENQITEQSNEEIADIKSAVREKEENYDKIKDERAELERNLQKIMQRIHEFCVRIKDVDAVDVPSKCPSVEKCEWLFHLLKTKLESAARKHKQLALNRMETVSQRRDLTTNMLTQLPTSLEAKISDMDDEEEEVPTRSSLKKEAQLIYETKSRRKGFRIHSTAKNVQF